jgi:thioredoxin 1
MNRRTSVLVSIFVIAVAAAVIYRETTKVDQGLIAEARARARRNHKFLMVEFGADWCSDCAQLSKSLEDDRRRDRFKKEFEVLYIDVGEFNRNLDIAKSLGIDVTEAIPAAAFFPPGSDQRIIKRGTNPILAFVDGF